VKIALLTALLALVLAAPASAQGSLRASAVIAPRQGVEMGSGVATVPTRTGAMDVEVSIANKGASSYVVQVIREGESALSNPAPGSSTVMRGGEDREVRFQVGRPPPPPPRHAPPRITYVISPMI
jgi:multidrug efflux pump subunit AcrA (membrane-fusion protein)